MTRSPSIFRSFRLTTFFSSKMPSLRLGNIAPDFEAQTTTGPIKFHEWIGNSWVRLFFCLVFQNVIRHVAGHSLLPPWRFHPRLHHWARWGRSSFQRLRKAQRQSHRNLCQWPWRAWAMGEGYQWIWIQGCTHGSGIPNCMPIVYRCHMFSELKVRSLDRRSRQEDLYFVWYVGWARCN